MRLWPALSGAAILLAGCGLAPLLGDYEDEYDNHNIDVVEPAFFFDPGYPRGYYSVDSSSRPAAAVGFRDDTVVVQDRKSRQVIPCAWFDGRSQAFAVKHVARIGGRVYVYPGGTDSVFELDMATKTFRPGPDSLVGRVFSTRVPQDEPTTWSPLDVYTGNARFQVLDTTSRTSNPDDPGWTMSTLRKTSLTGDLVTETKLPLNPSALLLDGGFLFLAGRLGNGEQTQVGVIKVDTGTADTLWTRWYHRGDYPKTDFFSRLLKTPDGRLLAVGASGPYLGKSNHLLLVKLTTEGEPVFTRLYGKRARFNLRTVFDVVENAPTRLALLLKSEHGSYAENTTYPYIEIEF